MLGPLLSLTLLADPVWSEPLGSKRADVVAVARPRASQLREAFDDFDRAMKVWQRERREMLDEQVLEQQRVAQRARDAAPLPEAALKKYKVLEVGKGAGKSRSRAKVIELPARGKLDQQLDQLEFEADQRRELCANDPIRCAREKKEREALSKGNAAWDDAVTVNYEKRRAAIEAEGAKIQAELDAARKREAQKQAEKLGGSVDNEGNFVDGDLGDVPERK